MGLPESGLRMIVAENNFKEALSFLNNCVTEVVVREV